MIFAVREISKRADIKKFIKFPHRLYKSNKQYVPQLDSDEFEIVTKSPSLEYCQIRLWMAYSESGEIVGRIAGIYNPRSNEYHNERRIRFGWFDFIEDTEVAKALLAEVERWGREIGMSEIHGPLGYNTWNRQGMLTEGFDYIPPVNCLYNYAYYPRIMDELGYGKQIDWIQVKLKADVGVPDKIKRINQMLLDKHGLRILDIREIRKESDKFTRNFFKSYNAGFKEIDNFVPLTQREIDSIAKKYFPMLKQELICIIVDSEDNIAAFGICCPSMSLSFQKARGKLFPLGFFHIMRGFKRYNTIDLMIIGAVPEWQKRGISSIYHTSVATNLYNGSIKYAITNPQAEHNQAYKIWDRYGFEPYMRRRCYIKSI